MHRERREPPRACTLYRIARCSLVDLVPMTPALDTPSPATLSTGCCAALLKARISRTCACSGRIRRSREESSFQHGRQRQQKGRGMEDAVPFFTKKTACNPTQTFTVACNYPRPVPEPQRKFSVIYECKIIPCQNQIEKTNFNFKT